jgi:hypothetical protein
LALRDHAEHMRQVEKQMKQVEQQMKDVERKMKEFEKELVDALQKDGYLKANESMHNIRWDDQGGIEVNDKPIRKEHLQKYKDLRKKHFGEQHDEFEFRH